ncbi:Endothelial zinc finger protein induced by tumor necrosis factor alpha [Rhodotorula toruloides]|nr:Endothelial zinc finger protein induced by tumor necrosis factor alpha [Rhodotorula toruloides]
MPPATRQSNRDRRYAYEGESSDGDSEQQASTSNNRPAPSIPHTEPADHDEQELVEEDEELYAESDGMATDDDDFDPHADFDEVTSTRHNRKGSRATSSGSRSGRAGAESSAVLPALPRLRFAPPPRGGALVASCATPPRALPLISGPAPPKKAAKRTLTFAGGRKGDPDKARPYVCHTEGCDKAFSRKSDLIRHERIHTDDRPYECQTCHKSFIQRSALTVHERVHTGERPHCCDTCQRSFSDSSSLARHRRVHTGARPYVCDVCGRDFCRKTTLTKHIAKVHDGSANNAGPVVSRNRKRAVNTSTTSQVRVGPLVRQYTYQQEPGAPYPKPIAHESEAEPDSPASLDRADLNSPFATPAHFASPEETTPQYPLRTNVGGAGGWGHRRAATAYEDNHLPPIQTLVAPLFGRSNSMPNVPQVHERLYSVDHFGHAYEVDEYGNALGEDVHLAPIQTPYQQHDHEQHAPHSAFPTYAPARAGTRGGRLAAPERVDRSPSPMSAPPTANPAPFSARPSISYEVEDPESEAYDEVEMAHVQPHGNGSSSAYAYRDEEEDEHEQDEQEQHLPTPATPFASTSTMPAFQQQPHFAPPAPGPSFSFSTYDRSTSGFASAPASHLRSPAMDGLKPHSSGGMNATLAAHNPQTSPLLHHVPPTFSPQSPAKSYTTSMRYSPMLGRSGGYVISPLLGGRGSSTGPTGSSSFFASPPTSHHAPPVQAGPSSSGAFSALTAPAPLASDRFSRHVPPLHEESQYHQHHFATPASPALGRKGYSARRLPRMMDAEGAGVGLGIEGVGRMEGSLREVNGWRDGAEDEEGRDVVKEEPISSEA